MISLLAAVALAASPVTDDLVYTIVDEIYGKPVPKEAICIQRPSLAEPFKQDVVVIGVMRGTAGCKTLGAMWDGSYAVVKDGLKKAIDPAVWSKGGSSARGDWAMLYTNNVVLAFDQFDISDPPPKHSSMGSGNLVQATFWQRTDKKWVAQHTEGTFEYDRDGVLTNEDRSQGTRWKSTFSAREYRTNGLPAEPIHTALEQQGRSLLKCVDKAWKQDHTIDGRTRMQWTFTEGTATNIALVAQDDDGSGISQCYYRAIGKIAFPPELDGTVIWAFNIARKKLIAAK